MPQFSDSQLDDLRNTYDYLRRELLDQRCRDGYWIGELSSSALATATAISALCQYQKTSKSTIVSPTEIDSLVSKGLAWIIARQNSDGGWGDTDASHSNIATTMLVVAALRLSNCQKRYSDQLEGANRYVKNNGAVEGLRQRYGKDKTFAVPILANCAIAELVEWKEVSELPFEAAAVPQAMFRFLQLPVVSYAIPALVAIGQAKYLADPPKNPFKRCLRHFTLQKGLRVLERIQPASGGFLEAVPLTSFVVMALAHSGRSDHKVARQGIEFIVSSFREQAGGGSWPIDTNLATWNTTLSINALCSASTPPPDFLSDELLGWLLECQNRSVHPYTGSPPGGWGWSDLSGSVPDADDTPGALLALKQWLIHGACSHAQRAKIMAAAENGIRWLVDLQNRDKGWPTFCRGWGRLPFDRSGTDITAHVIRAMIAWRDEIAHPPVNSAIESGFEYLEKNQQADGSWLPLWFGNQDHPNEENPVYGTAKVLMAYRDANRFGTPPASRGLNWLFENQNSDGGWGGGRSNFAAVNEFQPDGQSPIVSSLQETSLALEIIMSHSFGVGPFDDALRETTDKAIQWIVSAVNRGFSAEKWPIGFYFAKLWYYEKLYPMIFALSAVSQTNNFLTERFVVSRKTKVPGETISRLDTKLNFEKDCQSARAN